MRSRRFRASLGALLAVAALAAFRAGADEDFDSVMAEIRRMENAHQRGRAAQLCELAQGLATNEAGRLAARLGLGSNLVLSGRPEEGRAVLESLLESEEDLTADQRATAWERVGDAFRRKQDHAGAIQAYMKSTETAGANPAFTARAWAGIGAANFASGNYEEARDAYEKSVADPRVASIHLRSAWPGIGHSLRAMKQHAEARAAYARVLEAANADDHAKRAAARGIGHSYYDEGDYPAAATTYLELVEQGQQDLRIVERLDTIFRMQLMRADTLSSEGNHAEARAEYEKVFGMERVEGHHEAAARLGIADSLAAENRFGEARAANEMVLAMPGARWPDKGRAQMSIARCFEAEGNTAEARKAYEQVLEMKNISRFDRAAAKQALERGD